VATLQPVDFFGIQADFVYEHDDEGTGDNSGISDWISAGARMSFGIVEHFKLLVEGGYDQVQKKNGAPKQFLGKFTIAPTLAASKALMSRPELRLFATYAQWSDAARIAGIDSANIYREVYPTYLSGMSYGVQGEAWF